jgi:hypothetical protein
MKFGRIVWCVVSPSSAIAKDVETGTLLVYRIRAVAVKRDHPFVLGIYV